MMKFLDYVGVDVILAKMSNIKGQIREFFTSIDAAPVDSQTLHIAARVRLLVVLPTLFLVTFISLIQLANHAYDPLTTNIVLIIWSLITAVYILINSVLIFISNKEHLVHFLNYLCIFLELSGNQLVLYLGGSLTSHATLFIIVAVAVYRVFLDYRFALFAALSGGTIFSAVAILEISKLIPLSPGLESPVIHSVYSLSGGWANVIAGVLIGIIITFISINYGMNQVLKLRRKLEMQAILDGLTGIPNRRYFDEHLGQEWKRAARSKRHLSLIMVDIDNFKAYNDNYGHLTGDECLRRVAKELQNGVKRSGDIVARYGGEEFVILLPDTAQEGAMVLAELLRVQIENAAIVHAFSDVSSNITVSLGVATVIPDNSSPDILVEYADRALYQAKQKGRNRIEFYPF